MVVRVNKTILSLVLSLLALLTSVQITSSEKIQNIQDLQKLAEERDSNAQCLMGLIMYLGGTIYDPRIIETMTLESILMSKIPQWKDKVLENTDIDNEETIKTGKKSIQSYDWFQKSAEQENKYAFYCLAICSLRGIGTEINYTKAREYFKKSADCGFVQAQYELAKMLISSRQQDKILKGIKYLSLASNEGHIDAKAYEGWCCYSGTGFEKNVEYGLKIIQDCYAAGSPLAAVYLAQIYIKGESLPKNVNEGLIILEKESKTESNYFAQYVLGNYLLEGTSGIKQDFERGLKLLKNAAKGVTPALYSLGAIYDAGKYCFSYNEEKAFFYFKKAAIRENAASCTLVGVWYMRGLKPVKKDIIQARYWLKKGSELGDETGNWYLLEPQEFEQAAAKGSAEMQYVLGRRSADGTGCEVNIPLSIKLYQMSADQGNSRAAYNLGEILTEPNKPELKPYLNYEKGIKYLNIAATKNELLAIDHLGWLHLHGYGVQKNPQKAIELFQEAANQGLMKSARKLGECYLYAENVERSYEKAFKYLSQVEDASSDEDDPGLTSAITSLGKMYFYGWGCSPDRLRAVYLFSKAISRGGKLSGESNFYMGLAYYNGYGVDKDIAKSMTFFEKASKLENSKAIKLLKMIKSGTAKNPLSEWDVDQKT